MALPGGVSLPGCRELAGTLQGRLTPEGMSIMSPPFGILKHIGPTGSGQGPVM